MLSVSVRQHSVQGGCLQRELRGFQKRSMLVLALCLAQMVNASEQEAQRLFGLWICLMRLRNGANRGSLTEVKFSPHFSFLGMYWKGPYSTGLHVEAMILELDNRVLLLTQHDFQSGVGCFAHNSFMFLLAHA